MKNLKSIAVLTLIVAPIILFAYQNCANFENFNDPRDFSHNKKPIVFNSLSPLGYSKNINCEKLVKGSLMMVNFSRHLCAVSNTMCDLSNLEADGYDFDEENFCDDAVDYRSSELIESFSTSTADKEGYISSPERMCTFQIQTLVNVKTRTCVEARNGCEATFLKNQKGFTKDTASFCGEYNSAKLMDHFSISTATKEGYISNPERMCTFQIQTLVNLKTRTCVEARDGCEAAFLSNQKGFTKDTAYVCRVIK